MFGRIPCSDGSQHTTLCIQAYKHRTANTVLFVIARTNLPLSIVMFRNTELRYKWFCNHSQVAFMPYRVLLKMNIEHRTSSEETLWLPEPRLIPGICGRSAAGTLLLWLSFHFDGKPGQALAGHLGFPEIPAPFLSAGSKSLPHFPRARRRQTWR